MTSSSEQSLLTAIQLARNFTNECPNWCDDRFVIVNTTSSNAVDRINRNLDALPYRQEPSTPVLPIEQYQQIIDQQQLILQPFSLSPPIDDDDKVEVETKLLETKYALIGGPDDDD
jgi:hypothetical protein